MLTLGGQNVPFQEQVHYTKLAEKVLVSLMALRGGGVDHRLERLDMDPIQIDGLVLRAQARRENVQVWWDLDIKTPRLTRLMAALGDDKIDLLRNHWWDTPTSATRYIERERIGLLGILLQRKSLLDFARRQLLAK